MKNEESKERDDVALVRRASTENSESDSDGDYDDDDIIIYDRDKTVDGEADDAEAEYSDMSDDDGEDDKEIQEIRSSTAGFLQKIEAQNNQPVSNDGSMMAHKKGRRKDRKVKTMDLATKMTRRAIKILLDSQGQSAKKHAAPMERPIFEFLCRAQACNNSSGSSESSVETSTLPLGSRDLKYPLLNQELARKEQERTRTAPERRTTAVEHNLELLATQKLQEALDSMNIDDAMEAVEKGARVTSAHVSQCAMHMGDEYMPLLSALIIASESYTATRMFKKDTKEQILACANPIGAVMMSMHLDRWDRQDLTSREIVCLEDDAAVSSFAGGALQTVIMWKVLALFLAEKKARFVENSLLVLRRDRSVDEEVREVLKTQKVDRLRNIAATLRSVVCRSEFVKPEPCSIKLLPEPELLLKGARLVGSRLARGTSASDNPRLRDCSVSVESRPSSSQNVRFEFNEIDSTQEKRLLPSSPPPSESVLPQQYQNFQVSNSEEQQQQKHFTQREGDIFEVLHEYIRVTNLLISDAVSMRKPHLERDERLVRNGFLKQAREDFLRLREECMTDKQRAELERKARRKALLAKKKARKAKLRAAKKAKKAKKEQNVANSAEGAELESRIVEEVDVNDENGDANKTDDTDADEDDESRPNTPAVTDGEDTDGLADEGEGGADVNNGDDEDDYIGDHQTVVGGLELPPESDVIENEAWIARTQSHKNLLFERYSWGMYNGLGQVTEIDEINDEKWNLHLVHEDKDRLTVHLDLMKRRAKEAENGVLRTKSTMYKEGLPYVRPEEYSHEGSGGHCGWIIRTFYHENEAEFRSINVWNWLPLGWWRQARVKACINYEQELLRSKEVGLDHAIQAIAIRKSGVDQRKDKLVKFLKASRTELVAIGEKTKLKLEDDVKTRQLKDRNIAKCNANIEKCKQRVADEIKLIKECDDCLGDGTIESLFYVVDTLGLEEYAKQPNKKRKTPDDATQATMIIKSKAALRCKEQNIPEHEADIEKAILKKKEAEREKVQFEMQSNLSNNWMQDFACERFKVLLDVQELVLKIGTEVKAFDDDSDSRRDTQVLIRDYRETICGIFEDIELMPPPEGKDYVFTLSCDHCLSDVFITYCVS